ncbi:MAG: homocysteine S-methyltransferase family protein [Verrucomicrobiota bacterium]
MLSTLLSNHPRILGEGAIAEILRREDGIELHPTLFNTPLIYGPEGARNAMAGLYRGYLEIAREAGLPLLLTAPTWRLDRDRVAEAEVPATINEDAVTFLLNLRDEFAPPPEAPALVGALTGPKSDCYRPDLAPDTEEAEDFHTTQIQELAVTPAEFLLAQTLPSVPEALGIARAMSQTETPYLISFCTGPNGKILDGTDLRAAFETIDEDSRIRRRPEGYFVNCTHPRFITEAYPLGSLDRLVGIQANASSMDVTQLDGCGQTEADPIDGWTDSMHQLQDTHRVPVLGGCCGTTAEHLRKLARL